MKTLPHTLHRFLRRMTVREKALGFLFSFALILVWASSLQTRASEWNRSRRQVQTDLATQQEWLDRAGLYTKSLNEALERVDPSRTYAGSQLSGRIDNLLRKVGLAGSADIDPVRTREGEIFNDHNVRVRLNRVSIGQLIDFHKQLAQESPYINLRALRLSASRRSPEQLDARLEINSFDLKEEAIDK